VDVPLVRTRLRVNGEHQHKALLKAASESLLMASNVSIFGALCGVTAGSSTPFMVDDTLSVWGGVLESVMLLVTVHL
jgi:hypothetical protein